MRNNITNENKIFQESIEFDELKKLPAKLGKVEEATADAGY